MVSLTMEIPHLLLDKVVDVLLGRWCEFHRCCRGVDRCAPQLHLLINSLRAAHELRWGFFRALYTGTGPEVVSTGTRPP